MKEPSEKQKLYALRISLKLNKNLPREYTAAAYRQFINENHEIFWNTINEQKANCKKSKNYYPVDDGYLNADADWYACRGFDW